jgi:hypothetical protein
MTHFTVLVRYEGNLEDVNGTIEDMLEPYNENTEVERYKVYMESKDITRMAEHYKVDMTLPMVEAMLKLLSHMDDWTGHEGGVDYDENGAPKLYNWSTYNPKSKWDWYSLGGRWQGMLLLHVGKQGVIGEQGVFSKNEPKINADAAYLKDVDFTTMMSKDLARANATYDKAVEAIEKAMKQGDDAVDKVFSNIYFTLGVEDETRGDYLARQSGFSTHGVVDDKGWHEWSKMGWFGSHYHESETEAEWNARFAERFLSNPTDQTVIAIVDCHI